jgi:oxygen-independent coproporphyrinogen-3 oxidase
MDYLEQAIATPFAAPSSQSIALHELPGEFAMNALRLRNGIGIDCFTERTGLPECALNERAKKALERGWLVDWKSGRFATTPLGFVFLDSVLATLV